MFKKLAIYIIAILVTFTALPIANTAQAATVYKGTFESASYKEVVGKNGTVERKLSSMTMRNSSGRTVSFNIDEGAYFYINNTPTTIEGFKYGMAVEATVNLRRVSKLTGTSKIDEGNIPENGKELSGSVTKIDPNGMFIRVKLDTGKEQEYYINNSTTYFKGSSSVDLSTLYEGDRVKIRFSSPNTAVISELEIIQTGAIIENLYKATIRSVNSIGNRLTVVNAQPFTDWSFGTTVDKDQQTVKFNNATSIYVGNKRITKNQLRNYKDSDVYYVTTKSFGSEIVKKIIVLDNYERTFFDQINLVDTRLKFFRLKDAGIMYYHNGSILVRNGRLVEPSTLTSIGSAFVLTDGINKSNYTHLINITNDSFLSPNLASHELYFGKLSVVNGSKYILEADNLMKLKNNYWNYEETKQLSFSNNTVATRNNGSVKVAVTSLATQTNKYGYFYVKDGHVQAVHFLNSDQTESSEVITGRIASVNAANEEMEVKDVSQWQKGAWLDLARIPTMNLSQAVIIKDGKTISASQLKPKDRVVLMTDSQLKAHIILVNE
ncbi:hypothetical protein [Lysinibacillus sp. 54212]|uniref:hypothetical protein n=1 Tax=Lysinibacillus sp. 54212 TaxID=3119829 RepID=UPI002FC6F14F